MKVNYIKYYFILIILSSCSKPMREFEFSQNGNNINMKLFKDSTFTLDESINNKSITYSGNWHGSFLEKNELNLIITNQGFSILTKTPIRTYKISNSTPILIKSE